MRQIISLQVESSAGSCPNGLVCCCGRCGMFISMLCSGSRVPFHMCTVMPSIVDCLPNSRLSNYCTPSNLRLNDDMCKYYTCLPGSDGQLSIDKKDPPKSTREIMYFSFSLAAYKHKKRNFILYGYLTGYPSVAPNF